VTHLDNLDSLSQPEIYSLICECLYALKNNPKYSIISELAFLLEKDSFIKFIKYFGGMTITVPTIDEFKETISLLLLYQATEIDKLPWRQALEFAGYDQSLSRSAQRKLSILKKSIKEYKEGARHYE
jgi:hypothetical protein